MKKALIVFGVIFLASCGGGQSNFQGKTDCTGACGVAAVIVKDSASFNPNIDHGKISSYRVTISGEGIDPPIIANFAGSDEQGVIEGIPAGKARKIVVEAINPNNSVIREGSTDGVSIEGGLTAAVEVGLQSVPIFTNLADGTQTDTTRLVFEVFSDPKDSVVVEDASNGQESLLADVSTMATAVNLDVSSGLGQMKPPVQTVGTHTYKVKDQATGKASQVTVLVIDGAKRQSAPLFGVGVSQPQTAGRVSW